MKNVTFEPSKNETQYVPTLEEYSKEELEAMFYSKADCALGYQEAERTVKKLSKGKRLKEDKYCSRGLETIFPGKNIQRRHLVTEIYKAIFEEQRSQAIGSQDPEVLAHIYMTLTQQSQLNARLIAERDEAEAMKQQERPSKQRLIRKSLSRSTIGAILFAVSSKRTERRD